MFALTLGACTQQPGASTNRAEPAAPGAAATAQLPDYLPDYPGATRVEVPNLGVGVADSRSGNAIAMETADSPADVLAFYRARLAEAGVPIRADNVTGNGGMIAMGRDGEIGALLTVSRIGARTRIAVIRRGGR